MKANKFLIALALCVGFSSSITVTSQTPPISWTQSIKNRLSNWWNGAATQARNVRDYTVDTFKAIPQSVTNRVGQWKVSTQQVLLGALVTSLIGLGIYNRETILDFVSQVADQALQDPLTAATVAGKTGVLALGSVILYDHQQNKKTLDAKLLKTKFDQKSIDEACKEALDNNSVGVLKTVLYNRYSDPKTSSTIRSNIHNALINNYQTTQIPAVGTLKQKFVLEIIGHAPRLELNEE